eukprot:CAMPEP_0179943108 /NCGR_PEP_ID=MMETSP0983-20121128/18087_1 /TAXON_ID=483367 /ORGANISM="non described non described, Strain CCMP 2436" /LENGTH=47 /DNA_ID= /DNA_START= /DNA_END= /DNA_ORIENTATION=
MRIAAMWVLHWLSESHPAVNIVGPAWRPNGAPEVPPEYCLSRQSASA